MAFFKVRCTRNEDGTYTLSYGRQGKKLSCLLKKEINGIWILEGNFQNGQGVSEWGGFKQKKQAKADWEKWAASAYGEDSKVPELPAPDPDNPANEPQPTDADAPTDIIDVGDELSEYDRTLLRNVSNVQGPIGEWHRSMLRNLLKRLVSQFEPNPVKAKSAKSFPPVFKQKRVSPNGDAINPEAEQEPEVAAIFGFKTERNGRIAESV